MFLTHAVEFIAEVFYFVVSSLNFSVQSLLNQVYVVGHVFLQFVRMLDSDCFHVDSLQLNYIIRYLFEGLVYISVLAGQLFLQVFTLVL